MIKVNNVSKTFVSAKRYPGLRGAVKGLFSNEKDIKTAVDDISFEINDGEMVGYIGENGAGKSTSIKMMTGILEPTSGTIEVDGIIPSKNRIENAKNIGVVFGQRTQLWWNLPLCESFSILKDIYKVEEHDYKRRMDFLNETLDLHKFSQNSVRNLSLGQRMRADLAASLIHNPRTLFLDEPTIGLDILVKDKIRVAIKQINQEQGTKVILTTHDLTDIEELCSRILLIDNGKIIYDGGLDRLKTLYGRNRLLKIELPEVEPFKIIDFNSVFNISNADLNYWFENSAIVFSVNKQMVNISKIIAYVMSITEVLDIEIEETDLSKIVKNIYERGDVK